MMRKQYLEWHEEVLKSSKESQEEGGDRPATDDVKMH